MPPESSSRSPLDLAVLRSAPWPVTVEDQVQSTNQVLAQRAREGADEQVLVAELQTAGRGRRDRSWSSPVGAGLTFSVLVRPQCSPALWSWLPLVAGCAVVGALPQHLAAGLKWPNDVLIEERKVAGILAEQVADPPPAVVLGIGLNVSTRADELPVPQAGSLALAGWRPDRTALLLDILAGIRERLDALAAAGPGELAAEYRRRCLTIGRCVRVELPGDRSIEGTATGIEESGRLIVATAAGEQIVAAGDVVHLHQ